MICQGSACGMGTTVVQFNLFALRKAKIAYNFGLSECSRVKDKAEDPLPEQFPKYRSVKQDGHRFIGLFWKRKPDFSNYPIM